MAAAAPQILRPLSTVFKGQAFEYRALSLLENNLSMTLRAVGGRGDGGVDLQGSWWLPSTNSEQMKLDDARVPRRQVHVIAQCKAEAKRVSHILSSTPDIDTPIDLTQPSPNYVRELEGVAMRLVFEQVRTRETPQDLSPLVAILICQSAFTKGTIQRAMSSIVPFVLIRLPQVTGDDQGEIGAVTANPAFMGTDGTDVLNLGGKLEMRWERPLNGKVDGAGRVGLWWEHRRLANWRPPDVP